MIAFYGYAKCSTCRKAKKYLDAQGIAVMVIDITTNPPPRSLLRAIVRGSQYRLQDLFNRSGEMYRTLNMKEQLKTRSEAELLTLLTKHGRLIKRPIITDGKRHTVGFDEALMQRTWVERGKRS